MNLPRLSREAAMEEVVGLVGSAGFLVYVRLVISACGLVLRCLLLSAIEKYVCESWYREWASSRYSPGLSKPAENLAISGG